MSGYFKNFKFWYAVAILIGMIVGAGTFGIPYVFSQAGFTTGFFYLVVLGAAVMLVHLFYGEIILRTNEPYRLVGYAGKYLGSAAKKIVTGTILFEYYGALLAYIILGGQFLAILFSRFLGGSEFVWSLIFFLAGAFGVFCRLNTFARNEFFMTILLLVAIGILLIKGAPEIQWVNFTGVNLKNFFLPYGVILFAMAGSAAIPEMRQVLRGQESKLGRAIFFGTAIPAILYLLFALMAVGVAGDRTTTEAIAGLAPFLGDWVIIIGAIFGFLAVYTSFLVVGMAVRKTYQQDYRLKSLWSFLLACLVPLAAYLFGLKNFILIIGFIGAVASGLDGILTVLIYLRARRRGDRRPEYQMPWAKILSILLVVIFSLGVIYQLVYVFEK